MSHANLRRSGGSLTVTIPAAYRREHELREGDAVEIETVGDTLRLKPLPRRKITLQAIIDSAPDDAADMRAEGWDATAPAGREW